MFMQFLKRMAVVMAIVLAAQGCAIFISDEDDFHHHHGNWGHRHSSLQTDETAKRADGKQMEASKNSLDMEHQKKG